MRSLRLVPPLAIEKYCFVIIPEASSCKKRYISDMCADYTPSRNEQIEEGFRTGYPLLDLPAEAWQGSMAPILRGSHEAPGKLEIEPAKAGWILGDNR